MSSFVTVTSPSPALSERCRWLFEAALKAACLTAPASRPICELVIAQQTESLDIAELVAHHEAPERLLIGHLLEVLDALNRRVQLGISGAPPRRRASPFRAPPAPRRS